MPRVTSNNAAALNTSNQKKIALQFILAGLAYTIFIAIGLYFEQFWVLLLPALLAVFYWYFFRLDTVLYFVAFATPLSIEIFDIGIGGLGISLPTEPLIVGLMLFYFLKAMLENKWDKNFYLHPLSIAIILHLVWILFTSITSEMPFVSIKYFIARLWFVSGFYFLGYYLFQRRINAERFIWLFLISMTIVAIYSMIRLHHYSYNDKAAHWVMEPFFRDHTSYGAILALVFPFLFYFYTKKNFSVYTKTLIFILILVYLAAIILSYTRAAWLSLVAAFAVFLIYHWKIKLKTILFLIVSMALAGMSSYDYIVQKLEKNRQDSSSDLTKHVQSITNVSSDASNLERLNRWAAAIRMFKERPWVGWGPGTYQFVYAPFQMSYQKTIISTNAGDAGNAHSEYIGPLCEQGIPGLFFFLLIIFFTYYYASKYYTRSQDADDKRWVLTIVVALTTYFTHGFLNNYLDLDKASVPFWSLIAMLVATLQRANYNANEPT
ncbi:MAG: hypothetical protein KatS3mg034_0633 [Vicingaceae bacterium]|nr:MAG: hypothetical protein KatS3mg034_0633 [Vicingaceae bacterium]